MMRLLKLTPLFMLGACMGAATPEPTTTQSPEAKASPVMVAVETPTVFEERHTLPAPEPGRLTGLNPKQVQAIMGDPSLVRRDGNVQIMLFETQSCVFEIIFYEPNLDAHFIANHMNARNRSGIDIDLQTCLVNLLPQGQWLDGAANGR